MGYVFKDEDCKYFTPKAAAIVWFVIVPIVLISSYLSFTALIIWGSLLTLIAVVGTVMGR